MLRHILPFVPAARLTLRPSPPPCPSCGTPTANATVCGACYQLAMRPTRHPIGTPQREAVYRARAMLEISLFNDADSRVQAVLPRAYTGVPPEERNISLYKRRWVARVGGGSSERPLELGRFATREEAIAARRAWLKRRAAG
jgi:hypothetical protein